jgi:hypothetical protein
MMLEAIVGDASEARQGNILIYIYIHMNIYLSSVLDNLFVAPTPVVPATSFSASKLHGNQALTAFPPLQHSVSHAQKNMHKPRHGSLSKKACPRKHAQESMPKPNTILMGGGWGVQWGFLQKMGQCTKMIILYLPRLPRTFFLMTINAARLVLK